MISRFPDPKQLRQLRKGWSTGKPLTVSAASGVYEPVITGGTTAQYWRGDKTWQTLNKAAVGLGNVDNTSDVNKPVSTAQQTALNLKLDITSYTAADVLSKLLTVDGSGSGLDADTLDAHDTSYFLARANHTGTQLAATISDFSTAVGLNNALTATTLQTGRTLGITGDLVWTSPSFNGSGNVTAAGTIQPGVVSLAKMADVATSTVFYRKTAGTGSPEVQTLATLKTDLGLTGTNSGDQTITLTGDVTGSGTGSFATTIPNGTITLAKQANMATASVVYRKTAGAGAPEVQTLATLKTDLGLTGTNSGDQTITLTGDVTGSGTGSFAATIPNDTVTYAKMQNVSATNRLLGRTTAGAGDPEEINIGAWTSYTPTLTADSGTFTSASATGRYLAIGKLIHYEMLISVTTAGTASGGLLASLPFTSSAFPFTAVGRERAATGAMIQGEIAASDNRVRLVNYANAGVIANGISISLTGFYEAA